MRDLYVALRTLSKQPGFCVTAILTLALGIGANTALFSIYDAIIVRPLPYLDPSRLVLVWQTKPNGQINTVSGLDYLEWRRQNTSFEHLFGLLPLILNVASREESTQILGAQITDGFFSTLGVQPALGRDFNSAENKSADHPVAILSHSFWRKQFSGAASAIGDTVDLNGIVYTVIGVLPADFEFVVKGYEVWTPLIVDEKLEQRPNGMVVMGRLKPAATLEQAGQEMRVIAKRLELEHPDRYKGWSAMVMPLQEYLVGNVTPALTALIVAVAFVLLIACVNVANLLLARSEVRQREIAIRSALGASRARLVRLLVAETTVLALAGGIAGLVLAEIGLRLLITFNAASLPRLDTVHLDARVLLFAFAITAVTGLLFGLFPAHQLIGGELYRALSQAGRNSVGTKPGLKSRNVLAVSEIALSLMLLIGAGLMVRSVLQLSKGDRGFAPAHLLTFRAAIAGAGLSTPSQMAASVQHMLQILSTLPGVQGVAVTNNVPLDGYRAVGMYFRPEGSAMPPPAQRITAACGMVNAGYFHALGIPLLQGREFEDRDTENSPPVIVISELLARRYFPNQNAVGRKLVVAGPGRSNSLFPREIVGVAGNIRYPTRRAEDSIEIYFPYVQTPWAMIYVSLRTRGDPNDLVPSVRTALRQAGWKQPITDVRSMEDRIAELTGKPRLNSILASLFAALAVVLAGVGIYGVISYSTLRRAQEIGVRMALGATPATIVGWIVREATFLAAIGITVGLLGHLALSRVLRNLVYGIGANDLLTIVSASILLGSIAILASYIPARRAVQGDPMGALRQP